jgi:hypothetical protein
LRDHALDRLHDGLEPNGVEVRIEIPNDSVASCSCIRRFRSPDGWVYVGTILRWCPDKTHHVDTAGFDSRVPADTAPDLRIVFKILISGCSRRGRARCSNRGLKDRCLDRVSL